MPTQIGIDFTLSGQGVEPTEISALVGLGASKCWRMGDAIQGTQLRYEHDGWVFSTGYRELDPENGIDLPRLMRQMFQELEPRTGQIIEACRLLDLEAELSFILYMSGFDRPELHVDRDIVAWLARIDAEVDVDIFVVSEREGQARNLQ